MTPEEQLAIRREMELAYENKLLDAVPSIDRHYSIGQRELNDIYGQMHDAYINQGKNENDWSNKEAVSNFLLGPGSEFKSNQSDVSKPIGPKRGIQQYLAQQSPWLNLNQQG